MHKELDSYRVNKNREFFKCNLSHIINTLNKIIEKNSSEIFYEKHNTYQSIVDLNKICLIKVRDKFIEAYGKAKSDHYKKNENSNFLNWLIQNKNKKIDEYFFEIEFDIRKNFYSDFKLIADSIPELFKEDFIINVYLNHLKEWKAFGIVFNKNETKNIFCDLGLNSTSTYFAEFQKYSIEQNIETFNEVTTELINLLDEWFKNDLNIYEKGLNLDKKCIEKFRQAFKNKAEVIHKQGKNFVLNNFKEYFDGSNEKIPPDLWSSDFEDRLYKFLNQSNDGIKYRGSYYVGELEIHIDLEYFVIK